jgi:N-acetylmuramoyl-L-alanine amidase
MPTGLDLLRLAETRIGEKYVNVLVPKDNPNWHGPWDCAEFASWVVFQKTGKLYGCTNNKGNPATIEAYSGAWVRDAKNGPLGKANLSDASTVPGVMLIRQPPMPGRMGHIAISDGAGGTVEAAGTGLGVRRGKVGGRLWHHYAFIPEVTYKPGTVITNPKPVPFMLTLQNPNITSPLVKRVQQALKAAGCNPGVLDGAYGPHTVAAVCAFQKLNRLVADGVVGPQTAKKLGIEWP